MTSDLEELKLGLIIDDILAAPRGFVKMWRDV